MVWGPADADPAHEVLSAAKGAIHSAAILPFADLVSLIRRATVFLSGDCGPMHLASALGTPVVAIFLVSDAEKYRPLGSRDIVLDARAGAVTPEAVVINVRRIIDDLQDTKSQRIESEMTPSSLPAPESAQ
jgi:ADP-heptose:LPS heptosyltransferase